ncbi:type II secretion system protein [Candidatus Kaiserbacteria bacterium]|nr:type II secretion system protein [Candidatus Kaiserbacteria bacterium]
MQSKGFTLVELLIVIAVIGILASLVISSLNDARENGLNARITAEMKSLQNRAIVEQGSALTFDVVCGTNGETQATKLAAQIATINGRSPSTAVCNSDSDSYAVSIELIGGGHWCVDSTGNANEIASTLGSGVLTCPAS